MTARLVEGRLRAALPRLAAPIGAHRPDLVLHGHAYRGSFATELGPVPVRNVAVHVIGKDFEIFEL